MVYTLTLGLHYRLEIQSVFSYATNSVIMKYAASLLIILPTYSQIGGPIIFFCEKRSEDVEILYTCSMEARHGPNIANLTLIFFPSFKLSLTTTKHIFRVFSAIIFSAMIVGEAMSYLGDYTKATVSAAKIFKLIYDVPAIDAYSDGGEKEVRIVFDFTGFL